MDFFYFLIRLYDILVAQWTFFFFFLLGYLSLSYSLIKKRKMSIVPPIYHIALLKKGKKSIVPPVYHIALLKKEKKSPLCHQYII
jgi:hypothetical protein